MCHTAVFVSPTSIVESDESLFRYTSGRWLYNESEQMAQRYTKFDVAALNRIISTACNGASVLRMEKKEEVFNKSFIATLTNGRRVVARIKSPVAGPAHLTTASEVATMDFTRTVLGVPVPKVLAWSSQAATNGVGAKFILMESAPGVQLSTVWPRLSPRDKKNIVNSLIATEQGLLEARFSHYGSLYYKADLFANRARDLDAATDKFCIGLIADRTFYEDERASMPLDRGPCTPDSDIRAGLFRAVVGPQLQAEHLAVLAQYRSIVPALVPTDERALAPFLWHPDLNPGNIFPIDWQDAWAGPAYLQTTTPAFVQYTGPDASLVGPPYDAMPPAERARAQRAHKDKMLQKLYEIKQLVPWRHGLGRRRTMTLPVRSAGRTWKDGILPLKLALLSVAAEWPALATPGAACPLCVTREEVDALGAQRARYVEGHAVLEGMRRAFGMRVHGWVSTGEYGRKRKLLDEAVSVLEGGMEAGGGWSPFRDTVY
ncbi:kinase-like domain-containing protein [Mycena rosella]|uniref:Altered inheritance of mitochondria protein 9, mitochondrial n=1 Tax=Mycena rosella TaxID=1033263 RepID=A0AAD7G769_MYCRO|nr:kinase-like domain-containing protein [Mycena rosella]